MNLLDALEVVHKQQLRRHVLDASCVLALLVVQLYGQIPQRDGVIRSSDSHDRIVGRMPLHAGDLFLVEVEAGDWLRLAGGFPRTEIPDAPGTVIGAGGE